MWVVFIELGLLVIFGGLLFWAVFSPAKKKKNGDQEDEFSDE